MKIKKFGVVLMLMSLVTSCSTPMYVSSFDPLVLAEQKGSVTIHGTAEFYDGELMATYTAFPHWWILVNGKWTNADSAAGHVHKFGAFGIGYSKYMDGEKDHSPWVESFLSIGKGQAYGSLPNSIKFRDGDFVMGPRGYGSYLQVALQGALGTTSVKEPQIFGGVGWNNPIRYRVGAEYRVEYVEFLKFWDTNQTNTRNLNLLQAGGGSVVQFGIDPWLLEIQLGALWPIGGNFRSIGLPVTGHISLSLNLPADL